MQNKYVLKRICYVIVKTTTSVDGLDYMISVKFVWLTMADKYSNH